MTAKHSPATQLPWAKAEGHFQHVTGQDIDYFIHAANSYPRAIELLQYCADHAGIGNPLKGRIQAFLRELGEAE